VLQQAGAFRIGDTAGTIDNIVTCKLHRPGSVGFVSKSGGMSNEMYNVLSRVTDGLYEGDRPPPSTPPFPADLRLAGVAIPGCVRIDGVF